MLMHDFIAVQIPASSGSDDEASGSASPSTVTSHIPPGALQTPGIAQQHYHGATGSTPGAPGSINIAPGITPPMVAVKKQRRAGITDQDGRRSNRSLVRNAITHTCLAGPVNEKVPSLTLTLLDVGPTCIRAFRVYHVAFTTTHLVSAATGVLVVHAVCMSQRDLGLVGTTVGYSGVLTCMPGIQAKNAVLAALDESLSTHFVMLLHDKNDLKFRALYAYNLDTGEGFKLCGRGPSRFREDKVCICVSMCG